MKRWMAAVPAVALVLFAGLGLWQLNNPEKGDFERVSRSAPTRTFERLDGGTLSFSPSPTGETIVVNLFASWCAPCRAEHPRLMELSEQFPDRIFGVLYEDTPENGRAFLSELGNPFADVVLDPDGQGGLDFGLTGVPETFVISSEGEILLHIDGALDADAAKRVGEALITPRP